MLNTLLHDFKKLLTPSATAIIVSHHNPDGDALGSSMALYHYLVKKNIKPIVILPNNYPDFLAWLINDEEVLIFSHKIKSKIEKHFADADLIFCVDFNAINRVNDLEKYIKGSKAKKILIDHHLEPQTDAFDYMYSRPNVSSTTELIFEVIDAMGDTKLIDKKIAEGLYLGIITDTGSLSYSANYVSTYAILTKLVAQGIDCDLIQRKVYNNFTENRMRLFGLCLSKNLYVLPEYKTAYIVLSKKDLEKYSYQVGDTEGIVNYAMAIKGIDFAALFIERDKLIRISFRSYGDLSVNKIAKTYFEGGGHKNAGGANSYHSLKKTIEIFKSILPRLSEFC